MVRSPDGKQVTRAVVPQDCGPGKSFFVTFPTYAPEIIRLDDPAEAGCVSDLDRLLTPNPSIPEVLATRLTVDEDECRRSPAEINSDNNSIRDAPEDTPTASDPEGKDPKGREVSASPIANLLDMFKLNETPDLVQSSSMGAATAPPRISLNRDAYAKKLAKQDAPPKIDETEAEEKEEEEPAADEEPMEQKVLLVRVPPGVTPGHIIHVEIPGENRTVAATVPEGVPYFHVCYTPRPLPLLAPPQSRQQPRPEGNVRGQSSQMQQKSRALSQYQQPRTYRPVPEGSPILTPAAAVSTGTAQRGLHKLLLVRVPPGTTAGTTIHVSVPDEPGRILAAIVPAGNVREFHVSYESRSEPVDPPQRSFLQPVSPYRNHSMGDSGLPDGTGHAAYETLHYDSRYDNNMASY